MDMANGMATSQDSGLSNSGLTSSQGLTNESTSSVQEPASTPSERKFSQAEVAEFVRKAKDDVRRVQREQPEYSQQRYGAAVQADNNFSQPSGDDNVKRIVADTMQQMREQWTQENQHKLEQDNAGRIINSFWSKVNPAKEKYSDFESVTSNIGLQSFPNTVQLLAEYVDNSGDVLYALGKDMGKLATIEGWCQQYPQVAIQEIKKLSQSIRDNEISSKLRLPNEPLSQLQPKNIGTGQGSSASVRDLRAHFKSMGH